MLAAPVQQSFAVGEIGPALWGRTDLQWHASAAKELENFIATPHGPVRCRGGARFIAEVDDSADLHHLLPFRPGIDHLNRDLFRHRCGPPFSRRIRRRFPRYG